MYNEIEVKLKEFFKEKEYVQIAYLFGSYARGKECEESDVDILLYTEEKDKIPKLHFELERLLKVNVDLILTDEANACVIWSAIKRGVPLKIKNRGLFYDIMLSSSSEAEDFFEFNMDTFLRKQERKNYGKRR